MEAYPIEAGRDPDIPNIEEAYKVRTAITIKILLLIYRHANTDSPRLLLSLIFCRDPRLIQQMSAFRSADNSNSLS